MAATAALARRTVSVRGVPEPARDEAALKALFSPFGEVRRVQLLPPRAGRFDEGAGALVTFADVEDADAALDNMADAEVFGSVIRVTQAQPDELEDSQPRTQAIWTQESFLQAAQAASSSQDAEQ